MSDGIEILFCDQGRKETGKGHLYFWIYLFYLSKFYELLDTVLIVIRKVCLIIFFNYFLFLTNLNYIRAN